MHRFTSAVVAVVALTSGTGCSTSSNEPVSRSELELTTSQQQKLVMPDAAASDQLGNAVALSGNGALVGSQLDDIGGKVNQGSALVYVRSGAAWTAQQKLTAPNGLAGDQFGSSVALASPTGPAFVGASSAARASSGTFGVVYVFEQSGGVWAVTQELLPEPGIDNGAFGAALALDGDTLLVGGNRSVFAFTRQGSVWGSRQKLTAPAEATSFGQAVAVLGSVALVGSPVLNNQVGTGAPAGAAYVFERSGALWSQSARLVASSATPGGFFGLSVALGPNTALIGANQRQGFDARPGAVYVFARSGASWAEQARLEASDRVSGDDFGSSVALLGDMALVGARGHEHQGQNQNHGSAYLFVRSGSAWSQSQELRAADGQNDDLFGSSVALSGNSALIGSPNDDGPLAAQGSAYVFRFESAVGEVCNSNTQCTSGFCSDGRCCNSACSGACDACSIAAGAARDGECMLLPAGAPGSPACAPFICSGTSPLCVATATCGSCTSDAQCPSGEFCGSLGSCQPQKALGRACEPTAGADCRADGCRVCASGFCADGFCCNTACTDDCSSCAQAFTGEPNGTCAAVNASQCNSEAFQCGGGEVFTQLSSGEIHTCGLRRDGTATCWGTLQLGAGDVPPLSFQQIAVGLYHGCGIRRDNGSIACWGSNLQGQAAPPAGSFRAIEAGRMHTCAVSNSGALSCWGYYEAVAPAGTFISAGVGTATGRTCALRADGTATCFGQPTSTGAQPPAETFQLVTSGFFESCGIASDRRIACWDIDFRQAQPPAGSFLTVSLGVVHGCGIRVDGSLACWGEDVEGSTLPPSGSFKDLAVGSDFGCAIRQDDVVVCWGSNAFGQLNVP